MSDEEVMSDVEEYFDDEDGDMDDYNEDGVLADNLRHELRSTY